MLFASPTSLWNELSNLGSLPNNFLFSDDASVALRDLADGSALRVDTQELRGRSVMISTQSQLTAALALIELDGVAARLVLCPPDLPTEHLLFVANAVGIDAVVSDRIIPELAQRVARCIPCSAQIVPQPCRREVSSQTEWILLTSGTTGRPKLVVHTLASLAGAIQSTNALPGVSAWSTFYDIRRYGGLQIFLRAMLQGASLVLSSAEEPISDFLTRVGDHKVSHISGTPSHWRRLLMTPSAHRIAPRYIRLSGEIADQAVLDHLHWLYPSARISHAFASTEAGVGFEVNDGLAGFPARLIEERTGDVEIKIVDGSLRIRSKRIATRYIGYENAIRDAEGFVDTGDIVERRDERYYFIGRRDGVINVGGHKVHPEEVEAVLNRHSLVRMSRVRAKKNPITGAVVVADIVLGDCSNNALARMDDVRHDILTLCRNLLPRHKVPASINIVSALNVDATGKLARHHA